MEISLKEYNEWTEKNYALCKSAIIKESFYQKLFFKAATYE